MAFGCRTLRFRRLRVWISPHQHHSEPLSPFKSLAPVDPKRSRSQRSSHGSHNNLKSAPSAFFSCGFAHSLNLRDVVGAQHCCALSPRNRSGSPQLGVSSLPVLRAESPKNLNISARAQIFVWYTLPVENHASSHNHAKQHNFSSALVEICVILRQSRGHRRISTFSPMTIGQRSAPPMCPLHPLWRSGNSDRKSSNPAKNESKAKLTTPQLTQTKTLAHT